MEQHLVQVCSSSRSSSLTLPPLQRQRRVQKALRGMQATHRWVVLQRAVAEL
jgi:hypothetical protein